VLPVLFAYRTKILRISECSPWELVYGRSVRLPIDQMIEDQSEEHDD
jgi:hypothetical protein